MGSPSKDSQMSTAKVDSVFRTRSLGTASSGLADQYADGKAAKVWQLYIGDQTDRTTNYKTFLVNTLKSKGCHRVLDAAVEQGSILLCYWRTVSRSSVQMPLTKCSKLPTNSDGTEDEKLPLTIGLSRKEIG